MANNSNSFLAFLAGAATGAVLGILYAPDKGKNTRDKLSYQLDKYREKLMEYLEELSKEASDENISAAKSEGQKVIKETKEKAETLLTEVDELIGRISKK